MNPLKSEMFRNRLQKVFRHLGKQARKAGVRAYRVYDHDLPEYPLCIEFYDAQLYIAEYKRRHNMTEEEHDAWMEESISVIMDVLQVPREAIHLKLRQRKPGRLAQYQKLGAEGNEFEVSENDLIFFVNLQDYLDTGLFLDHRITRQMVREISNGKRVLNLFAYTGSFSVYAAAGGASEVLTVDLSNTYLKWAERNMQRNGFSDHEKFTYKMTDVKQFLPSLAEGSYDIIVMDPPTFSNSKKMKDDILDIQRDHAELINQCLRILTPGGSLYFSTNFRKFEIDTDAVHTKDIKDITRATTPFDFEGKLFRFCYLLRKL